MALVARAWMRKEGRVFEALDAPLRSFDVEPHGDGGARVALPLDAHATRATLVVASADAFQAFCAAAMREATTPAKRFYDGAFDLAIDGVGVARGKRMVSFERGGARILHAWAQEAVLHTTWKPVELQMAMRLLAEELGRVRESPSA